MSHPAEGEVSQISTVQLPTLLDSWNTGESDAGKGPLPYPHHFRMTTGSDTRQEKEEEAKVQPDMEVGPTGLRGKS